MVVNKIGSFAVLDLETTGLPDHNFNKANITEIAIHGFATKDVRNATTCDIPRINHKLSLIFNPLMMIHPKAEEITGLDNYMLEKESSFDANAAAGIISFLKHLRQPVCLVAHNGNSFDFPLFKQSLEKHNLELPNDLVCIDTLVAIKELDKLAEEAEEEVICFSQEDEIAVPLPDVDNLAPITIPKPDDDDDEKPFDSQKLNETTPKRPPNILTERRKRLKPDHTDDETSPEKPKIKSRRSLFDSPTHVAKNRNTFGLYKLESIYTRLFGEAPQVTHHAEADVVVLQKIMLHYGKSFVEYAEAKATPFANVKKVGAR